MSEPSHGLLIRRGAWDGDHDVVLPLPASWQLVELRLADTPPMSQRSLFDAIAAPVEGLSVAEMARGKKSVGVIVDDLTRPTCADEILPPLLDQLGSAGVNAGMVTLFIATGSHSAPAHDDLLRKAGPSLARFKRVVVHDCHGACTDLGRTHRGTPVFVNTELLSCELKVGISSVFPHPAAGFSGGTKLLAPGMCGAATIRHLHDHMRCAPERGGTLSCELRDEMRVIAQMAGLDHSILALPGSERKAVACLAGPPEAALERAVDRYRGIASVTLPSADGIDVVIMDAYPFDGTLQFAHDRALWPLAYVPTDVPAVLIAECQRGAGTHEFFPAANPILQRIWRRIQRVSIADITRTFEILSNARALLIRRRREIIIVASGVGKEDVRRVFPRGILCRTWEDACRLIGERTAKSHPRVAVFHTSPLLLPRRIIRYGR